MDNKVVSLLSGINFETAMLEACDWDIELCNLNMKKVSEYFQVCEKTDVDIIKVELSYIFSEKIANIIIEYIASYINNEGVINEI